MDPSDDTTLRDELHALATPAGDALRAHRVQRSRTAAVPRAVQLLVVAPLLYLVLCLLLRGLGVDFGMAWWIVAALSIPVPVVYLGMAGERAGKAPISDVAALTLIDDGLGLQDRLSSAREYLDAEAPTPFMQAAIEDAHNHTQQAQGFELAPESSRAQLSWRDLAWPAAGALAFFLATLIDSPAPTHAGPKLGVPAGDGPIAAAERLSTPDADITGRTEPKVQKKPESQRDPSSEEAKRGDAGVDSDRTKKSRGQIGRGKSSTAQSTSGRSSGDGEATDQAQPTKGGAEKPKKPKKQKPAKKRTAKKANKTPKTDKNSVASSGQGRGQGSSKSPTASDWTSKDQSIADDEDELEDEDDVDDEDEESDARGGLQPSLRQRKPPVNRDLTLGFGGGPPPPHANGRGGPGLPKKQRGVAQLVLGIPYPDQITGKPNAGRTKVTQERIEPQAQETNVVPAEARLERSSPLGHLSRPVLTPWMQDLVRAFQKTAQATLSETLNKTQKTNARSKHD